MLRNQGVSAQSGGIFPTGGGELGALIRQFDWAKTSLGPLAAWPQSLKTITETLLRSPVPIVLLWGVDGIMIYNDAYSVFAGGRHPKLLGSKVRDGWAEVADFNDNVMKVGLSGRTLAYRDQEFTLYRHGRPEQVWMNLDYSPVVNEAGEPAGVIAIVVETTQRVMAERQLRHVNEILFESQRALKDRESELARVQQIARIGGVNVDLRNGFDNGKRAPEYLEIHGLDLDSSDTHEDWVRRLHPDDRDRALQHFLATVNGSGLVSGSQAGTSVISATYGGQTGTATVTVTGGAVTSITVTPTGISGAQGATQQFTAKDQAGNDIDAKQVDAAIGECAAEPAFTAAKVEYRARRAAQHGIDNGPVGDQLAALDASLAHRRGPGRGARGAESSGAGQ